MADILNSLNNNIFGLIALSVVLIVAIYFIKTGKLSYNGKGLQVGKDDRRLLEAEWDLARAIVECIPVEETDFEHLVVRGDLLDKIQTWIVMNNINNSKSYIKTKQYIVRSVPKIYDILDDPDEFTGLLISELIELKENWK